ncbi:MAG: hypothetical protein PHR71_05120 [Polaromonas sp.]|nr:hypothetical protein [Polaromonas sp.]
MKNFHETDYRFYSGKASLGELSTRLIGSRTGFAVFFGMISMYIAKWIARCRVSMFMEVRFEGLEALSPGIATVVDQP